MIRLALTFAYHLVPTIILMGCTAASLATLQGNFRQLYEERSACQSRPAAVDVTTPAGLPCGQSDEAMLSLAQEAEKGAADAKDPRTKISMLRLAGVSAWQAGPPGQQLATKVALEGGKLCDELEVKAKRREVYGAPRDCAILVILPALVSHSAYVNVLERLKNVPATDDTASELQRVADNYADNTVIFMVGNQAKATGFTGLDPSVVAYISAATKHMFCSFRLAEQVALANPKYDKTVPKIDAELTRMAQRAGLNAARDC
jgi:hypothetical protein